MTGFGECTKCNKWADIPSNFNESKHFMKCPICNSPMYLIRGFDPIKDLALRSENKVVVTNFIKHNN